MKIIAAHTKLLTKAITIAAFAAAFFFSQKISAQNGTWVWMHGASTPNAVANYGTIGVAAPTNDPPAMYETTELTDLTGKFWIFGGLDINFQEQSALWMYDPATNMWTWMKGPNVAQQAGVYGTQGVPSPANYPGSRSWGVMSWTDATGNLWIFGGYGYDASGMLGALSDLWKYNIATNQWTWMSGPNTVNGTGTYGTLQVPALTNSPPARFESAVAWTASNGDLWMYGGGSFSGYYNDVWRYTPSTNMWTWMSGANTTGNPPSYGTFQVASPTNTPGGRYTYGRWKDNNGNFWLFGGEGTSGTYADMWKYNTTTNQWTWMAGSNVANALSTFTTQCVASTNYPASRYENRCAWTDDCGRFWQYGGFASGIGTLNDLWMFDPNTNLFTWVGGGLAQNTPGNYGTMGIPAPSNYPDAGAGGAAFRDQQGNFWMFGAWTAGGKSNSLWKYTMSPNCPAQTFPQVSITNTSTGCAPQTVSFNASTNNSGYTYHWDFGDPSTTADTANTASGSYTYTTGGTYTVTLIVSGNIGCANGSDTAIDIITIAGNSSLNIGNDTATCGPFNITLNAGPANSYLWSTGATTQTITVNTTGSYWVTVNSATCPATDTLNITNATGPNLGPDQTICQGGSVTFNAGVANAYAWNTGATTQTISPTTSGQYYVDVTIGSCNFSDSVNLTVVPTPLVNLGMDTTLCGTVNLALDAGNPGASYVWSTGATSQTINANATGTYWVTVTNSSGNTTCSSQDSIVVTTYAPPAIGNDTTVCQGQPVTLNGGTGTGYFWSTGATTQTINVSTTGIYWVDVSNGTCVQRDSIQVTVNPLPLVNLGIDTTLCPNTPYVLDAGNPGATYTWNTGNTTQTISIDSANTYSVIVTQNNCTSRDSVNIYIAQPVSLGEDLSLCGVLSITLDPHVSGNSYLWSTGQTSPTIDVISEGQYWLQVNTGNCTLTDTINITGAPGEGMLYIPNTFTPNGNGDNDRFMAVGVGVTSFRMRIFDRWGMLLYETNDLNAGWDGKFKGKTVQVDTYVYVIDYQTECDGGRDLRTIGHVNVLR